MKNNASLVYGFFLVIGDFLALIAAFASAYFLRVKLDSRPVYLEGFSGEDYLITLAFLIPFWLVVFGMLALYNKNTYENRFSEFGRLVIGSFVGMLFLVGYGYINEKDVFPTRLITLYAFVLAFLFVLLFRTLARAIRRSLFSYGIGVNNILVVGDTAITTQFIEAIANTRMTGYRVIGIVGTYKKHGEYPHYNSFGSAVKALEHIGVHSIIQTELYANPEKNTEILSFAQENHIAYRFMPGNNELFVGNIDVDLFYAMPIVAVHQTALVGWGRIVKRLFDVSVSSLALIILSPVFLIVGLISKLTEPRGKIFFKQTRLTRFNREFKVYKFRSMHSRYGKGTPEDDFILMGRPDLAKQFRQNKERIENDPRITRLGRFLRATSLDELPQLWNVLRGDISLVGPRALIPQELKEYKQRHSILSVKSGLTGLAQISGRKDISFDERRKLDIYYVQNWSFWNDLVIIAKTFSVILFSRGAK